MEMVVLGCYRYMRKEKSNPEEDPPRRILPNPQNPDAYYSGDPCTHLLELPSHM